MKTVYVRSIPIGEGHPLVLISGPCVIETEDIALRTAEALKKITGELGIPFIYKSSFEKDNRSTAENYRGPGLEEGLKILEKVRQTFDIPVLSDIHRETDIPAAAEVLDVIQIPAFLCQQTSLLIAAGKTGKPINVKKGQFLAPDGMRSPVNKITSTGNDQILLTERGTCFGYYQLVADMRAIPIMKSLGYPVVFDATHIVRIYGVPSKDPQGGQPGFVPTLVYSGVAAGCNALFLETHPCVEEALCDASSMIPLDRIRPLLERAWALSELVRSWEDQDE
ncbi:MAG: 3-deoxy-8-phosphooctulonate synthase [Deltaproteobacteria bacterium]|nr:MAG: 3-deoxy-8-phosphooctulonate synthase [Deltaproteobacteria bacterium]